jgi:hypothetical protein
MSLSAGWAETYIRASDERPALPSPMGKVRSKSALMYDVSGRVGRLVFRRQGDQTIVQMGGERYAKPSKAQKKRQGLFKDAADYAKKVLSDPLQQAIYRGLGAERNQPPNALLISNYLNPPKVDLIELSGYHRKAGDVVKVLATDDIEVVSVTVRILDADGAVLEAGPASKVHGVWIYRATVSAPARESLTIEAIATDRPGHSASLSSRL